MSDFEDSKPQPLAYATPERARTSSTRDVVFACFTLAAGVGYSLGAVTLTAFGVGLLLSKTSTLILLPFPIFIACVLAMAGYAVIGSSWRIIAGGRATARQRPASSQVAREIRAAVGLIALGQLIFGTAVLIVASFSLTDRGTSGELAEKLTSILVSAFAVFTGVLILRMKL